MSKPTFDGLVRSNFWKGRQRLNRLYRWIANVVRPKIDGAILFEAGPQNNPEVHDFLVAQAQARARHHEIVTRELSVCCSPEAYLRPRNWPPRCCAPRGGPPAGAEPALSSLWRN